MSSGRTSVVACCFLLISYLVIPFPSHANTIDELKAKIAAIMAQIAVLQTQVTANTASLPSSCPVFARTLARGVRGDDVRRMQDFLKDRGYFTGESTGYFGGVSEKALQDFQKKEGIISLGGSETGFGVLGPKTRARILAGCSASPNESAPLASPAPSAAQRESPPAVVATCPLPPAQPRVVCSGGVWEKVQDLRACTIGFKCTPLFAVSGGNKPPVVTTASGPRSLVTGENGTWTIVATDPEQGLLSYAITWGDEETGSILDLLAGLRTQDYSPSGVFTHSFLVSGTYFPEIIVRDIAGNSVETRLAVTVVPRPVATSSLSNYFATTTSAYGSCYFAGVSYPESTETEGYSVNDLCLATGGICSPRLVYVPKFTCASGGWTEILQNPYPELQSYAGVVGSSCSSHNATRSVSVAPNTQICRGLLCAVTQNYATVPLTCAYTNWVDWGVFSASATTTTICAEPTPCEYGFGNVGRACAAKQNNACPQAGYTNHPLGR